MEGKNNAEIMYTAKELRERQDGRMFDTDVEYINEKLTHVADYEKYFMISLYTSRAVKALREKGFTVELTGDMEDGCTVYKVSWEEENKEVD